MEEFERSLREALLRERLERLVTDGVGVTPAEGEREFRRRTEQVKAEYVQVDAAPFRAAAAVTDEEAARGSSRTARPTASPSGAPWQYLLVDAAPWPAG